MEELTDFDKIKLYNLYNNLINNPTTPIINDLKDNNIESFITGDVIELIYTRQTNNTEKYESDEKKIYTIRQTVIGGNTKNINIILLS